MAKTQRTISMQPVKFEDGSYGVNLIVSGLDSEDEANAAIEHMQSMFCDAELTKQ